LTRSALGPEGPCGPDTEIFVDTTGVACQRGEAGCRPGTCDCGRFVEVWNNVFITFQRRGGQLLPLPQANVDTGMGLERTLTVLNGAASVYQTPPLDAIHQRIASLSPATVDECTSRPELVRALRVLTDQLRSAVFILGDQAGVLPSNQGRGYVLRRLIRRAVRACQTLGIQPQRWARTAELVIERYGSVYPELPGHADRIASALIGEAERFEATLGRATAKLRREIARRRGPAATAPPERQHGPAQGDRAFPADGAVMATASRGVGCWAQSAGPIHLAGAGPPCRVADRGPRAGSPDHSPARAAAQHGERGAWQQGGQVLVGLGDLGVEGGQQGEVAADDGSGHRGLVGRDGHPERPPPAARPPGPRPAPRGRRRPAGSRPPQGWPAGPGR
jgi:hypothetical protein